MISKQIKRIFRFLDNDWVKLVIVIFAFFRLYAILRYFVLLRIFDHTIQSPRGEVGNILMLYNTIPFVILFILGGMVLGIILKQKAVGKSLIAGIAVIGLIQITFPYFITYLFNFIKIFNVDISYPCLAFPFGTLLALAVLEKLKDRPRGLKNWILVSMIVLFVWQFGKQASILYRLYLPVNMAEMQRMTDYERIPRLTGSFKLDPIIVNIIRQNTLKYSVNKYFSVLTHIRMEPGYTLDYVYYTEHRYGLPVLYAHKTSDPPFKNSEEFKQARGEVNRGWGDTHEKTERDRGKNTSEYLNHVMADDMPEGYFQYILLRIIGDQFCLWDHARYRELKIIFDYQQLRKIMLEEKTDQKRWGREYVHTWLLMAFDPWILIHKAAELNFQPSIKLEQDRVRVRIVTFNYWEGLVQRVFIVRRAFPHAVINVEQTVLVPYICD